MKLLKLPLFIKYKLYERKFGGRLKYLYINKHSDTLLIVFSAFGGPVPHYNYVKSTGKLGGVDRLFILDDFGFTGSYYWYEKGNLHPMNLVNGLLEKIIKNGNYKFMITAGSSKGGTCALYYGIKFNVNLIISGACQYYVGKYVNQPHNIRVFYGMMGDNASNNEERILNEMLPTLLKKNKDVNNSRIELIYSKAEPTYARHIVPLINDLKTYHYQFVEHIDNFKEHSDIGICFPKYLCSIIKEQIDTNYI